ncbi:ArgE/DapE family deacylase [Roseospira marina]|uniref:ArgE/DapE family deacylase n=1 Tax=Roseospira marina TaxID=140057 RepID=A0A5M6IDP5_9PROT|nr:ArgE/DapE family deacylase [Roseospira marina]KAA5606414.1 ArgE/DapE family deacylase [Roseospira marina]MBB4314174.1 acetylornithine deacetylase [Roseospira marina]MBB5087335.1 acetylornithine deacetylase [Roseospira marina]
MADGTSLATEFDALDAALRTAIGAAVDGLQDDAIALLSALVREDSQMGQEAGAQVLMAETFAGLGLEVDAFEIDEAAIRTHPGYSPSLISYAGRRNVVGCHRPAQTTGKSLILNGHIDVVPPGDASRWTHPPFEPVVRDGRLYGRGSGDMKAGIVAYTLAFKALQSLGYAPAAPVFLQSVVEEECTGNGALACLVRGYRADAAIIPEPFAQTLMTAQIGVLWCSITVTGLAAHMIDRTKGTSAIDAALLLAEHMKTLEAEWNAAPHPAYADVPHPINFNLGRIEGGEWTSSVPETCTTHWRLSFYPGMTAAEASATVEQRIRKALETDPRLAGCAATVTWQGFQAPGFEIAANHPMLRLLDDAHRSVAGRPAGTIACTCTTDARFFNLYGDTPATCYGPEATAIHTIDESVSLQSLRDVTAVLALFMAAWCGLSRQGGA